MEPRRSGSAEEWAVFCVYVRDGSRPRCAPEIPTFLYQTLRPLALVVARRDVGCTAHQLTINAYKRVGLNTKDPRIALLHLLVFSRW